MKQTSDFYSQFEHARSYILAYPVYDNSFLEMTADA